MLHPRYTQFGQKMKPYVGLRENALEAWKQRVLAPIPNAQPHEFLIIKVIFTAEGFMTYATDTYTSDDGNWSVPRFHKAFAYGNEYGAWRFYGGIPINATGITGAALVRLETPSGSILLQLIGALKTRQGDVEGAKEAYEQSMEIRKCTGVLDTPDGEKLMKAMAELQKDVTKRRHWHAGTVVAVVAVALACCYRLLS